MMPRIYITDDEKHIRDLMAAFLSQAGYRVEVFARGDDVLQACRDHVPDILILDVMMPGADGFSICATLRQEYPALPIIIVSAKDSPYDRVTGLTLGSDDYLVKPFLPLELVARVKALLRRAGQQEPPPKDLQYGDLYLAPDRREASLAGNLLSLTPTEFDFLVYLLRHQDRAVSRDELLQALWHITWQGDTRATDDLVKRLRRKLRNAHSSIQIETVWGFGFRLTKQEDHR